MRVAVLASGSSGNAIVVESNGTAVLVDAGISGKRVAGAMDSAGLTPETLSAVLVTHEHSDHIKGFDPKYFKDISIIGGKGCSGCREACYIALSGMTESQLEKIGKSIVMFGADVDLTEIEENTRLYLVGNCTFANEIEGERIEGCPPPGIHVKKCLLGEY